MKSPRSFILIIPLVLILFCSPIASWADPARPDSWAIQCVDCPKFFDSMTDHSLRLDDAGYPHIAYGGGHLYYAWRDASGWHYETADPASMVGSYASLVLDANGYPHISYQDSGSQDLKYAYKDAAGWHFQTVDNVGSAVQSPSMAIDTKGWPHIAYQDLWNCDLKYAYAFTVDNWIYLPLVSK